MKFEREYLLKADLREEIFDWVEDMAIDNVDRYDKEKLADMIFYRLLHAGDLRERRPMSFSPKKWLEKGKVVVFSPKSLKMKVDADSPFKGETI